jgi:hypothetical protein
MKLIIGVYNEHADSMTTKNVNCDQSSECP